MKYDPSHLEPTCQHYIGGRFVPSHSSETFKDINPANGEWLTDVSLGDANDIDRAVEAAKRALKQSDWVKRPIGERAQLLRRIGERITERRIHLATLESMDTGKPISESLQGDIPRAAANFQFYSELACHRSLPSYTGADGSLHRQVQQPLGVCGLIVPWNLPLYLATWKIAPALMMGNAVILKPAELTPLTAAALCQIMSECGLPSGIFNVVHGFGPESAGEALVTHPEVAAISFTGEGATGCAIQKAASPYLKRLSFELGGKGASVVFADCDLEKTVKGAARAAFRNQGQVCLAGSRLLVEESVAPQVVDRMMKEIRSIQIGHPLDETTSMGSLISHDHRDKVAGYVSRAQEQSSIEILTGGKAPEAFSSGAYYEPTLITNVEQNSPLVQEEVFGPVLTVQTFRDEDEALSLLNGTSYGLSCSVWTQDLDRARRVSLGADEGIVWINGWMVRDLHTAFGGMKRSGVGREGGLWSLDFFAETKTIVQCV